MDEPLKQFLDGLDWEALIVSLTREAARMMAGCRWGGRTADESRQMAEDYALDTMTQAYDGCLKCTTGRFDPRRLRPGRDETTEFFVFLRQNILRRLIIDDIKKAKRRSKWPSVPLEDGTEVEVTQEEEAETTVLELVDGASEDVERLVCACLDQLERNPKQLRVIWTQIEEDLGWTRYKREQTRPLLEEHLKRVIEKMSKAN